MRVFYTAILVEFYYSVAVKFDLLQVILALFVSDVGGGELWKDGDYLLVLSHLLEITFL